jgi:tetratricopeptide (TPR) repeat protein
MPLKCYVLLEKKMKMINKKNTLLLIIFFLFFVNSADADITAGLIGYWPMDKGVDGNIIDGSNTNNTATCFGTIEWSDGKFNKAIYFDGTSTYLNCGRSKKLRPTSQLTVSAWVNVDKFNYYAGIASNVHDTQYTESGFSLLTDTDGVFGFGLITGNGSMTYTNEAGYSINQWYHLAGVYDGSESMLYVNGVKVNSNNQSGLIDWDPESLYGFEIGRFADDDDEYYFQGAIDDVGIWSRALDAQEIAYLYNYGMGRTINIEVFEFVRESDVLKEYLKDVCNYAKQQKYPQAIKSVNVLLAIINNNIVALERELAILSDKTPSISAKSNITKELKEKEQTLQRCRMAYHAAALLKANLQALTQEITQDHWLSCYRKVFETNEDMAGSIMRGLTRLPENSLTEQQIQVLLSSNVAAEARGELALWFIDRKDQGLNNMFPRCIEFYENLLGQIKDAKSAGPVLIRYLSILHQSQKQQIIDQVLDNFIVLFPDTALGAAAALQKLETLGPGSRQKAKIIKLANKYPKTKIENAIKEVYIKILLDDKQVLETLALTDSNKIFNKLLPVDSKETAEEMLALGWKAIRMSEKISPSQNERIDTSQGNSEVTTAKTVLPDVGIDMVRQLYNMGEYAVSIDISYAILKKADALPKNLITGLPIMQSSDVGAGNGSKIVGQMAKYFAALVYGKSGNSRLAETMMNELNIANNLPAKLQAYVLFWHTKNSLANNDYDKAVQYASKAMSILPNSLTLIEMHQNAITAQKKHALEIMLQNQLRKLSQKAISAIDTEERINTYQKCAELQLALGNVEQAVGTYLLVAEEFPDNSLAPQVLDKSIYVLEHVGKGKYKQRVEAIKKMLVDNYSDCQEAKKYQGISSRI